MVAEEAAIEKKYFILKGMGRYVFVLLVLSRGIIIKLRQ